MKRNNSLLRKLASNISDVDRRFYRKGDDIAAAIIEAMRDRNMSQKDLATRLGKKESYVSRVLGGGVNLTLRTITEFEAALGTDIIRPLARRKNPRRRNTFQAPAEIVQITPPDSIGGVGVDEDGDLIFRGVGSPVASPARRQARFSEHDEMAVTS
jgi:transcriptional regulator with XRE-family HTH domain